MAFGLRYANGARYTEQLNINLVPIAWPLAFATVRLTFGHATRLTFGHATRLTFDHAGRVRIL
ncbi:MULTISPECIES: hypothetical protein [Moorena]|uniref:hypothetical protein n=1 Tax=Moorena TaxID=1155738 RepID=UPI0003048308|nr:MULTISPECIES: hypothetical protein [Moorena]NEP36328.1 hypothetical protein [Moorena sp. SIO3B2]NEP65160.1 hypothetical protein [Moorena sp. SIO3A5]NEQ14207.1 hypothetical protein [Moorena sp. SIO3E2]NES41564.1 hypothetical protein [Moorena sp. SIO2C4]